MAINTSDNNRLEPERSLSLNRATTWMDRAAPSAADPASHQEGLLQVVWRRRWIVTGAVVLSLIAAWVYLLRATPIYSSQSQIFIEQSGPRVLSDTGGGVVVRSDSYLSNECVLITSTPIL